MRLERQTTVCQQIANLSGTPVPALADDGDHLAPFLLSTLPVTQELRDERMKFFVRSTAGLDRVAVKLPNGDGFQDRLYSERLPQGMSSTRMAWGYSSCARAKYSMPVIEPSPGAASRITTSHWPAASPAARVTPRLLHRK